MSKRFFGLKSNITMLSALSLVTMHLINRIQTTSANANVVTHTREDKIYEWRYGKISYKKKGYGSPILLVHDLTVGSNKDEFLYIYTELSKNHTVYLIDLLGYGDSDKPVMTYTASLYEQLLSDFIKTVIAQKTDIIVTGDSAPIALRFTHDNSDFAGHLILINPLGLYDQNLIPSSQTKIMKFLLDLPVVGTYIYNLSVTRKNIEKRFTDTYILDVSKFNKQKLNTLVDSYFRASHVCGNRSKYVYASYISKYLTVSILHELKEINNSILIIGGQNEPDINNNIENYLYYNNSIEYQIINNTAHLPHIENPKEIIEDIEVFLS